MISTGKMHIEWTKEAIKQYKSLKDRKVITKINQLIESLLEDYKDGLGKPKILRKYSDGVFYSRRVDQKNRLIYEVVFNDLDKSEKVIISQVVGRY